MLAEPKPVCVNIHLIEGRCLRSLGCADLHFDPRRTSIPRGCQPKRQAAGLRLRGLKSLSLAVSTSTRRRDRLPVGAAADRRLSAKLSDSLGNPGKRRSASLAWLSRKQLPMSYGRSERRSLFCRQRLQECDLAGLPRCGSDVSAGTCHTPDAELSRNSSMVIFSGVTIMIVSRGILDAMTANSCGVV